MSDKELSHAWRMVCGRGRKVQLLSRVELVKVNVNMRGGDGVLRTGDCVYVCGRPLEGGRACRRLLLRQEEGRACVPGPMRARAGRV